MRTVIWGLGHLLQDSTPQSLPGRDVARTVGNMVTVATFNKPEEAHLLRMRLEAAGIAAYVQDENMVQLDILKAIALGGVRVQIAEKDLTVARELLAIDHGVADYHPSYTCPRCGSHHVAREPFSRRVAYLSLLLFAIPLLWLRPRLRCDACLHTWKGTAQ